MNLIISTRSAERVFYGRKRMTPQHDNGVMQLFIYLASFIFGHSAAHIIGPYAMIIAASCTGAAWSLGTGEPKGKVNAFFYFVRISLTAVLLTVAISDITASFFPSLESPIFYVPVALVIGLIGDNWYQVGAWLVDVIKRIVNNRIGGR